MAIAADQLVVSVNDLDEKLNCEICTEIFKRAKILLCGHTFCQECLEKWAKTNKGKELTCPTCRKSWRIPDEGIAKLPANYHVNSLVDLFCARKTAEIGSGGKKCEFCVIKEASLACVECRQLACDICAKVHQRTKTMENHRVVGLKEYKAHYENKPTVLKPNYCDQHPGIPLKYYCQTCSVPICLECTIIEHRVPNHQHVYLNKAAGDARKSIEKTLVKATEKLKYFNEKKINIKGLKEKLAVSGRQATLQVKNHTENLLKQIQKNEKEILTAINKTYGEKVKVLDSQFDRIELATGQVTSSFQHTKNLVAVATDAGLISVSKKTQEMLESLLNEEIQVEPQVNHHLQYSPDPVFKDRKQGSVLDNKAVACKSVVICRSATHMNRPMGYGAGYYGDGMGRRAREPDNRNVSCQLVTRDMHGHEIRQGGAEVTAEFTEGSMKVACTVNDNNNGTYNITLNPPKPHTQPLRVFVFGQLVNDIQYN